MDILISHLQRMIPVACFLRSHTPTSGSSQSFRDESFHRKVKSIASFHSCGACSCFDGPSPRGPPVSSSSWAVITIVSVLARQTVSPPRDFTAGGSRRCAASISTRERLTRRLLIHAFPAVWRLAASESHLQSKYWAEKRPGFIRF